MEGNSYHFAAIRGVQARSAYFVVMIPLRMAGRLFAFDDEDLPPELRAQRVLSKARVPQIARYLVDNPRDYILSALCASVDGELRFEPAGKSGPLRNVGTLFISMSARILLNDGQHRRAAIEQALKECSELENETISVVVFADRGLARSQQMFADLNKNAVRPSGSLSVLFDHRDPLSRLSNKVLEEIPFFRQYIEPEKTTISNRQAKLYTLSSLNQANELLAGKDVDRFGQDTSKKALAYWEALSTSMPDWTRLEAGGSTASELRTETVHAHGVMLQAFGLVGAYLLKARPKGWTESLKVLSSIDWSRRNKLWEGRVLRSGRINGQRCSVQLAANVLLTRMSIPFDDKAHAAEESLAGNERSEKLKGAA